MVMAWKGLVSKREFWRGKVAEQAASGLSAREFCRREGLSVHSFYGWRRALSASADDGPVSNRGGEFRPLVGEEVFAPVMVSGGPVGGVDGEGGAGCGSVEVLLPGGIAVRVRPGFDAPTLTRVIAALSVRC